MEDKDRISREKGQVKKGEIDLIELIRTLWDDRRTIVKTVAIFAFLGLLVALFSEKEYTASTIMVPQIEDQSPNLGGLSSLASLAGVDLDMNAGGNGISPMLYPMIVSSAEFQLEIMNDEYQFEEIEKPTSLLDYYINIYNPGLFGNLKKYTIGLPGLIRSSKQEEQIEKVIDSTSESIRLTMDQEKVREIVEENLSLVVNENDGYLTLVSHFHQAVLSAQVAQKSQKLLQEYVTQFKVEKAAAQLEFIRERYEENKAEFEEAQSKLAAFRDANKNISSEVMRTNEELLQSEYQLAFDVYSELAKQLEQTMIKVEEDTPVFSVINEVVVPIKKSKPKRSMIMVVWLFLGGITGIVWVFGKIFYKSLKRQWEVRNNA